jgi:hypothetical protein
MPQSIFLSNGQGSIDGVATTGNYGNYWNLGVQYLGPTKAALRRCIGVFDVFGAALSGRPLTASDVLVSAELVLEVVTVVGPAGWGAGIERVTRLDWDYTTSTWNEYKAGGAWTVAGGDVASPPAAVAFTSPAMNGEQVIGGMIAFVTDAIASRGGKVVLRLKADDEVPAQTQWCSYEANIGRETRARLRVTYESHEAAPIGRPEGRVFRGARPAGAGRTAPPAAPSAEQKAESREQGQRGRRTAP